MVTNNELLADKLVELDTDPDTSPDDWLRLALIACDMIAEDAEDNLVESRAGLTSCAVRGALLARQEYDRDMIERRSEEVRKRVFR